MRRTARWTCFEIQVTLLTLQHMELKEKASKWEKKASDLQAKLEKAEASRDATDESSGFEAGVYPQ